ncbi:MAG: GNAT family N-acetyltransferase [Dehalococcoidia bacterium]|nr:GNAT family N-acetyltransferase [Dehalococcoidia bacterium]MCA9854010.1 GNAT family N-acetyltransferase [Dehalococcoidia bacterium]
MLDIRDLTPGDGLACDAVMRTLPDWFGYEPGLEDCARAVRTQAGRVAVDDGEVVGFATWERRTGDSAEITWAAVRKDRRNSGVGTSIVEAVCEDLRAQGFRLALAMTSARSKDVVPTHDAYEETRAFWRARGFLFVTELNIWETDFALLMVRPLGPIAPAPQTPA